jgi:hypothetical protein
VAVIHEVCGPLNRGGIAVLNVVTFTADQLGDESRPEYAAELGKKWKAWHGKREDGLTRAVCDAVRGVLADVITEVSHCRSTSEVGMDMLGM